VHVVAIEFKFLRSSCYWNFSQTCSCDWKKQFDSVSGRNFY